MLKAIARIQTAVAIAQGNGDTAALSAFQAAIAAITPFAVDPYILPDVLTPADVPAAPVPTSIQEAHDMVQAGVITREDAVDSGVIQTVDQLPPHPDEQVTAPEASTAAPVDVPVPEAGPDVQLAPVTDPQPAPVAVDPVPVTETTAPVVSTEPAPTPEQVIQTVVPDAAVQPDVAPVVGQEAVAQADPGDEDPTPPEKETIASLDKRIDQLERPGGKVSRQ